MNTKIIGIVAAVIVLGGGWYVYSSQHAAVSPMIGGTQQTNTSTGMRVEENAVVAQDQKPGSAVVVSQVYLAAPGYVVIHEVSGKILGSSALLQAGQNNNVTVQLYRATKDGEMLHAMLHNELGHNTAFDEKVDMPVKSKSGSPIMGMFTISAQASDSPAVSI